MTTEPEEIDVFVAVVEADLKPRVLPLVQELRRRGLSTEVDYAGRSLKGQLTHARTARREGDRRVGARALDPAASRPAGRRGSDGRAGGEAAEREVARPDGGRAPQGARRAALRTGGLGGEAARPRRARLHRPPRRERPRAARDQSRTCAGGGEGRARDPQRVRALRRGRGRRARARGGQPEPAHGRGRAAGGRARDRLALRAAAVPARRRERRGERSGCVTATSTCDGRRCSATCASRRRSSPRSGASWTRRASSTCGRRT